MYSFIINTPRQYIKCTENWTQFTRSPSHVRAFCILREVGGCNHKWCRSKLVASDALRSLPVSVGLSSDETYFFKEVIYFYTECQPFTSLIPNKIAVLSPTRKTLQIIILFDFFILLISWFPVSKLSASAQMEVGLC